MSEDAVTLEAELDRAARELADYYGDDDVAAYRQAIETVMREYGPPPPHAHYRVHVEHGAAQLRVEE